MKQINREETIGNISQNIFCVYGIFSKYIV